MSDTAAASSSTSSTKLNSSTSSTKKRTLSDAGLDDTGEGDSQNNGKRVVVFEAFKLFDVQSAVSLFLIDKNKFSKNLIFFLQEELDAKLLLIQNKKLSACVQNCRKAEVEWKAKIDQLETNKASVDCKWSMIDLYWTQVKIFYYFYRIILLFSWMKIFVVYSNDSMQQHQQMRIINHHHHH